ncbi:TadE/TadG family type IV pilus assembly protein [Methylobacterium sp. Leaf108]|uniref:TadE/TadG family type IV pilus assembly protein n=1 Tax=Methylobacterium sp. Leaf108 TaxID=1736256 RepID=UPI00190FBFA5|nr:TadE/TadG family type IV pilus assembly protein [Methylobacterium sp. Leaf108]
MLEFALVLPILVVLVFGCFELGRALLVRQAMEGAVRAGARSLARVPDPNCRPGCSLGAQRSVRLTRDQILAETSLPASAISVAPVADPPEGTVVMEATVAFDVTLLNASTFRTRWDLTVRHQEQRIGE